MGGGGAVGFAAIQIAVATGCHVATTCGGQSIERLLAAGAEQAVDYITEVVMNLFWIILLAMFRYFNYDRKCYSNSLF